MLIELTEDEICFIRQAGREFRTAAPSRIANDPEKLASWREERELLDPVRASVDRKMTDALAEAFDLAIKTDRK